MVWKAHAHLALLADTRSLHSSNAASTLEGIRNRSSRPDPSPFGSPQRDVGRVLYDCFEFAYCLAFIVVSVFALMGFQVVCYPIYGPFMWTVSQSSHYMRNLLLISVDSSNQIFAWIGVLAVFTWTLAGRVFDSKQAMGATLSPVGTRTADLRIFAVRTSIRTPRSSRRFLRRVSADVVPNGPLPSPSIHRREILSRPAIPALRQDVKRIITPKSAKRASIFDLFALNSTDPAALTSTTPELRGSRPMNASSGKRDKNSVIDDPECGATKVQDHQHVSERGSQGNSQRLSTRPQRLSTRSVRRSQVLCVKTNLSNLPVSRSLDKAITVDKGKSVVRDASLSSLSSMRVAPVDLRAFSFIATRTMAIVRSSSLGNCAAGNKCLRTTGSLPNVKDFVSRTEGARSVLASKAVNGSFLGNKCPLTPFRASADIDSLPTPRAAGSGLSASSFSETLQPIRPIRESLNASSSRTVRPADANSGRTVRASPTSRDGLSNRTVRPLSPTPDSAFEFPTDNIVVAAPMPPRKAGAKRRALAVIFIKPSANLEVRELSPPPAPAIRPAGVRTFVSYYDMEEDVNEQERQAEQRRGGQGAQSRNRPPPPPPVIPALPQPVEVIPSIPGVRTFVPYYDTEEDIREQERQAERRRRRREARAERDAARAFLPRCRWTGRAIEPAPVDPLPSGARLSSLRVDSAYG